MTLTLLDRLLYAEVGSSFSFGLGLFTALLVMNHLFYLARLVIGQGVVLHIALILMVYKVPYFIAFSAPMGLLLATVLAIGRLSDQHEIAALRIAGVSLYRIARPVVLVGAVVAAATLAFSEGIVSLSDDQYRLVMGDVMSRTPEMQPVQNVFFQAPTSEGNALYSAHRYDPRSRTLEGVTVVYLTAGSPLEVIEAERAEYVRGIEWMFHDGHIYLFPQGSVVSTKFQALDVKVPRSPQEFTLPPKPPSDMSFRELAAQIALFRRQGAETRALVGEMHTKVATALSCIVFALIALPLSLRPHRSGPSVGFGLSVLVLVGYYAIAIPAQLASDGRLVAPVLAAWLPDVIVGAAGVALLARASR